MSITDRVVFLRQLKENFETTGALTPSSRFLAKAIVTEFAKHTRPSLILEVGPGTGVFTKEIAKWMSPEDELHICEINSSFASHLRHLIESDSSFEKVRKKIQVFNQSLQTLSIAPHYDYIISGLPLNNFELPVVNEILSYFESHLYPDGMLSYFEYIGIRRIKLQFLSKAKKQKLLKVDLLLRNFIKQYQVKHQIVSFNIPPAYARHFRF